MIEKLQHKYALSPQGAKDMIKACIIVCQTDIVKDRSLQKLIILEYEGYHLH